jgi:AcrR family transcriptional regulator
VREAVIEAAQRLFAEKGIHGVSVREIAREVGVSHTLLHLYFGGKDEIVRSVLAGYDGRFADNIASAVEVDAAVGETFRALARDPEWVRVLAAALVEGIIPARVPGEAKAPRALVERAGTKRDDPDAIDPRVLSAAISALVLGWAVAGDWLRDSVGIDDLSGEQVSDEIARLLERLVRDCV